MSAAGPAPARALLRTPLFRLLCTGETLAAGAEALFLVCLTLLVLRLTGPGPAVGWVLGAAAVPRALLLLPAGVVADRIDPVRIVVVTTWARTVVLAVLTALVLFGPPPVLVVAALASCLGVLDAAYFPASLATLPRVVPEPRLARANALVQGAEAAGDTFGPALAALLVAVATLTGALGTVTGLYAISAVALTGFARRYARTPRHRKDPPPSENSDADGRGVPARTSSWAMLRSGLRFALATPIVRIVLAVLAVLNLAVIGPVLVGGAVLAQQRLGGVGAFGLMLSGFGVGSLFGLITAGIRVPRRRGAVLVLGCAAVGAGTAALGVVGTVVAAAAVLAVVGVGAAYLGVALVAWLQEHVPGHLHGRVMSLVMLSTVAFDPLSYALAGALLPAGTALLFLTCGGVVVLCALACLASPTVRKLR